MPYPWVNTLLLGFVAVSLASGYFGLTNGDPDKAWILWLHSVAAYAILALLAWKGAVVVRSLRRNQISGTPRMAFIIMAALFLFVLGSGLVWSNAGRIVFGQVSLIELHQIVAVIFGGVLAWHVLARRWVLRMGPARDRRAFLRLAAGAVTGVVLWQAGSVLARVAELPGAKQRFTGSYETGSFTGHFPRVSWFFDDPDPIRSDDWHLTIDGKVGREVELAFGDLAGMNLHTLEASLDCTGGWYTTQDWSGVRLADLLEMASPGDGWHSVEVISVTGFNRRFSKQEADSAFLALAVAGRPLTHAHGAPLRLVVPDHRGFDWVKWVTRIRVHDGLDIWQPPLPLQ